jgi:hypothetical protein
MNEFVFYEQTCANILCFSANVQLEPQLQTACTLNLNFELDKFLSFTKALLEVQSVVNLFQFNLKVLAHLSSGSEALCNKRRLLSGQVT